MTAEYSGRNRGFAPQACWVGASRVIAAVIVFTASCISLGISTVAAATPAPMLLGIGAAHCKQLVDATVDTNTPVTIGFLSWAQGYMTAINFARSRAKLDSRDFSDPSYDDKHQLAYLLTYCENNPNLQFVAAATDLYIHLPTVHKQQTK